MLSSYMQRKASPSDIQRKLYRKLNSLSRSNGICVKRCKIWRGMAPMSCMSPFLPLNSEWRFKSRKLGVALIALSMPWHIWNSMLFHWGYMYSRYEMSNSKSTSRIREHANPQKIWLNNCRNLSRSTRRKWKSLNASSPSI